MQINEMLYYIMNKPYFDVTVLSNNRKIKKFVVLASGEKAGQDFFLICKPLKMAWFKPITPIIDGLKFKTFVDINNAIPLVIEESIEYETHQFWIKEIKKSMVDIDKSKMEKSNANGEPINLSLIPFPPTVLYQKVEGHFVKLIMSAPASKWEELKWVLIAAIGAAAFIIWNLLNSGIKL